MLLDWAGCALVYSAPGMDGFGARVLETAKTGGCKRTRARRVKRS